MDMIRNGQAFGGVAATMLANNFDIGAMRPYIDEQGRACITRNEGGKSQKVLVQNTNATLRINEWKEIDSVVIKVAKSRLRVVTDLNAAGLTYNLANGMGKTVLQTQTVSDITDATISMDPARISEGDRPEYDFTNLPLPIIHKDFQFTARQIATSRNDGQGIDMTTAELAARRVAEGAEQLVLGVSPSFSYGGGSVYGMTNYPNRMTKTLTLPTAGGWTPATLLAEFISMRQKLTDAFHFGPYMVYVSPNWSQYLDNDYSTLKGDNTVRDRLKKVEGIQDIRTSDFLTGYQIIMVQLTSDVIRLVNGMSITTLQWESFGGLVLNFKVMAMIVPQLRMDHNSQTGIVHGVAT